MISVWCSQDRHKSLNQAKNGQNLPARDCETPVLEHYELGNLIGISGTPALIFPDGRLIPGYMDVDRLVSMMVSNRFALIIGNETRFLAGFFLLRSLSKKTQVCEYPPT